MIPLDSTRCGLGGWGGFGLQKGVAGEGNHGPGRPERQRWGRSPCPGGEGAVQRAVERLVSEVTCRILHPPPRTPTGSRLASLKCGVMPCWGVPIISVATSGSAAEP